MTQRVSVPGVGMLEFPDGMAEPDMAAAIKKNFPEIHTPEALAAAAPPPEPAPAPTPPIMSSGTSLGAGTNAGMLGLLGMPTDTVLNAADVVRSGYSGLKSLFGIGSSPGSTDANGKVIMPTHAAPFEPIDKSKYVGSTQWLMDQARKSDTGKFMVDNPDSNSGLGRILYATGAALPSVAMGGLRGPGEIPAAIPASGRNIAVQGAMAGASGAAGQAATEAGASPALAALASFAPTSAVQLGSASARGLVRGGDAGRQDMTDRVNTLNDLGITNAPPSVTTGNVRAKLLDSLLGKAPGSNMAYYSGATNFQDAMKAQMDKLQGQISPVTGPTEAGLALKSGIGDWKEAAQANVSRLYDKFGNLMPPDKKFDLLATLAAAQKLSAPIPGAPNITQQVQVSPIQKMIEAILTDAAGRAKPEFIPGPGGRIASILPATPAGLRFDALKQLRTEVGPSAVTSALIGNKEAGQWKQLYGGMSQDLGNAASQVSPQASAAFSDASAANKAMMEQASLFGPFAKEGQDPEAAYRMLSNAMGNKGPTAQTLLGALPADARATIAATKMGDMGLASAGNQNWRGDKFSSDAFLTKWNGMNPETRAALFAGLPEGDQVAQNLTKMAKASDWVKQGSRAFSNPSGTTGSGLVAGAMGGIAMNAFSHPLLATGGLAGLGGMNVLGRYVQSPMFMQQMMAKTGLTESQIQSHLARLALASESVK